MNGVELLTSWFTPTVLFCVLNVMIGTIFITSSLKPPPPKQDEPPHPPPPLVRVPSFFERVKSFNLSSYQSPPPDPVPHGVAAEETAAREEHEPHHVTEEPHHVTRSTSESAAKAEPQARVLQKSASEKMPTEEAAAEDRRRPATTRERAAGEDEAVDEKANDFINRFRQQLKLQRLDSILRYKEMLNRGAGR